MLTVNCKHTNSRPLFNSLNKNIVSGDTCIVKKDLTRYREHKRDVALVSSVFSLGALLSTLLALAKAKKGKMFNLKLNEGDILALGIATVTGATFGGCLADDKKNYRAKIKEASHQIVGNIATPLAVIYAFNKCFDKLNIKLPKIKNSSKIASLLNFGLEILPSLAVSGAGLWTGVNIGNKVSNIVNKKIFDENHTRRDVKTADYCIHIDDPMTALTVADKSGKLRAFTGKIMPFVFMLSGYQAAMAEE